LKTKSIRPTNKAQSDLRRTEHKPFVLNIEKLLFGAHSRQVVVLIFSNPTISYISHKRSARLSNTPKAHHNMFTNIIALLSLSTLTLALPTTYLTSRDALQGSCTNKHLPTEEQYTIGYNSFCDTYLPAEKPTNIYDGTPLVATFDLTAYDGGIVKWIYKISALQIFGSSIYPVSRDMCKQRFAAVLDSNDAGGLGKGYCVVDGTGGDAFGGQAGNEGMSGQGQVLVQSGNIIAGDLRTGRGTFETRQRADDK
jgi:hypothetical protein